MKLINFFILAVTLTGCSTFNKTMVYSSLAGSLAGGLIGKELSPNKQSENFNTALGAGIGAIATAGAAYFLYREARPDLKLKSSPLDNNEKVAPLEDPNLSLKNLGIGTPFEPIGKKEVIELPSNIPKEVRKTAKRQYYRKHKTKEMIYEEDGRVFKVPSFEIIESGVE